MREILDSIVQFFQAYYMFIILGVLLLIIYYLQPKKQHLYDERWCRAHYDQWPSVLTKNEQAYYSVLAEVVGNKFVILAKVRLEDIFQARRGQDNRTAHNKISSRHVDFLLCKPITLIPVLGIEIDDKSHNRPDRIERDTFVNHLFQACGLPLLHVKARYTYSREAVHNDLQAVLNDTISS